MEVYFNLLSSWFHDILWLVGIFMSEEERHAKVSFIFKYRGELPLDNKSLRRKNSFEQIYNWPDNTILVSYEYLKQRVEFLESLFPKKPESDIEDEEADEYLLATAAESDPYSYDDFCGPRMKNERAVRLQRLKKD